MQRVVTLLPLADLWDDTGPVAATPVRDLTTADIRELLRVGPVRFVVADLGNPLRWVPVGECFRFWKAEVQSRVAGLGGASLNDFPGGYCYFAAEWGTAGRLPVVLLSVAH